MISRPNTEVLRRGDMDRELMRTFIARQIRFCWTCSAEGIIGKSCTEGQSGRTKSTWSSTTNISWMVGKSKVWYSATS